MSLWPSAAVRVSLEKCWYVHCCFTLRNLRCEFQYGKRTGWRTILGEASFQFFLSPSLTKDRPVPRFPDSKVPFPSQRSSKQNLWMTFYFFDLWKQEIILTFDKFEFKIFIASKVFFHQSLQWKIMVSIIWFWLNLRILSNRTKQYFYCS